MLCIFQAERLFLDTEFEKLGLSEFEKQNKSLAINPFDGNELSAENRKMLDYFLSSGTYGTVGNNVNLRVKEYGGGFFGKLSYFFRCIFMPMEAVKDCYPFFYKHKVLLPFLFPYRIISSLMKRKGRIKSEISALTKK